MIESILKHNVSFVAGESYKPFITDKFPDKKIAILSCMDTRLVELLPAALGFKNGDVKIIKNAGALMSHPYGSVMRSLLVSIYELGVENILVVGHTGCGMAHLDTKNLIRKMKNRGVTEQQLDSIRSQGIDIEHWMAGFTNVNEAIQKTVEMISSHPLLPHDIKVYGFVIDSTTGELYKID